MSSINKKYNQLKVELKPYMKAMIQASETIIDKEVSTYPIMIAHQQELELGIPIVTVETYPQGKWNIHASSLEEFVAKQIITPDKVQNFRGTYKDVKNFVCVFSLSELGAQFVFLPRPELEAKDTATN